MKHRALAITACLVTAVAAAGYGARAWRNVPRPLGRDVTDGLRYADSLATRADDPRFTEADAVAALYIERARLGMGSPFRLAAYVLDDPAISIERRRLVAGAILGRVSQGQVYSTPPEALDLLSAKGPGLGLAHRMFMEGVLDRAPDVRAGELALRLAYQVTAASGATAPRAAAVALAAIAQARDRALAIRDVRVLLTAARRQRVDPLELLADWRATRRFGVEQPLVDPMSPRQERQAAELLPRLVRDLEQLDLPLVRTSRERVLPTRLAVPAADFAQRRQAPPQAPIVVTMGGFSNYVVAGGKGLYRQARASFVQRSRSEETLVAEYTRLRAVDREAVEPALAVLTAAVAMRPYAQEEPWLPGDYGPAPAEVRARYGLASLTFDANVPLAWRTYYARMFDLAVTDLRRVFPRLDLTGLAVRFGESPLKERALALHDPMSRTVYFPVGTGAGAIAHELAHDMDWQAARRRYGSTASYRTDRSVRQFRDGLAAPIDRMTANGRRRANGTRPTEVFARGVDWLVAQALAQRGILNGYLSAVQDEWLTGYASATPPRRDVSEPDGTMAALHEIADVSRAAVGWYDRSYGSERRASLAEGVRRTLVAPLPRLDGPASPFQFSSAAVRLLRQSSLGRDGWTCQLSVPSLEGSDREVTRRAMEVAAATRARGVVARWATWSEGANTSARIRTLGSAPWDPSARQSAEAEIRDALLWRASRPDDGRPGTSLMERLERQLVVAACARGD